MSFLRALQCPRCGVEHSAEEIQNLCSCGSPLLTRYDLASARAKIDRASLGARPFSLSRYRELLPVVVEENVVSLGEGGTPLLRAAGLGQRAGLSNLYIKDEAGNPTGSFKARGLAVAISKAKELGVTKGALPSAGNAAGALSAYAAKAGIEAHVFMPADVPELFQLECLAYGAKLVLVDGLITDCGRIMTEQMAAEGWFDFSTLKEPYRLEGKKTMGYELAEQFGWRLPEVIIYPTGGGTGLIGMWKAFGELQELGWIEGPLPRMVTVQSSRCAPMVCAFEQGLDNAPFWENADTIATGLRVPQAVGDFLILRALRESDGTAVAVSDEEIVAALHEVAEAEGLFACPEGAATWAACKRLVEKGWINRDEHVVLFNTGTGLKYVEILRPFLR